MRYNKVSTDMAEITIMKELNHCCENVTDGVGTCVICGLDVYYGDCNDDGIVNVSDAVVLKKYLAGDDTMEINVGTADVNPNRKLEVADAVKLMKYLAGVDAKLGVLD